MEKEGKSAIGWFKMNDVIVKLGKFQGMIMSCDKKESKNDWNINNSIISAVDSFTHSGIEIDNKVKLNSMFNHLQRNK